MIEILVGFSFGLLAGRFAFRPKKPEFVRYAVPTLENAVEDLLSDVRGGSPHAYEPRDDVSHLKLQTLRDALERRRTEGIHVFYCAGKTFQTGQRIVSR